MVDALYYGLLIIYRGVSFKISRLCGMALIFFMTADILTAILKNLAQVDLYSIFRMIIPRFVKNLVIAFILVTPTSYPLRLGTGNAQYGRPRTGAAYKKNAAYARNMNDADSSMKNSAKKRHGMGVMSAKLFSAMVTGMTTDNLHDFDVMKRVGNEFKDVFSDKDFKSKDSSYPYSKEYYEDMRDNAKLMLDEAWDTAVGKMSEVHLGGSSGSEAVRQARLNASDMVKRPNEVEISTYDRKIIDD